MAAKRKSAKPKTPKAKTAAKPKFGSPAWQAKYGTKRKGGSKGGK